MAKMVSKSSKKMGLAPGTLVHVGDRAGHDVRVTLIDYDENAVQEKQIDKIEECWPFKNTQTVTWINVDGLHQIDIIEKIGRQFEIHPLVLEDVLHTGQRPKTEDFDRYIYVVLRMLDYDEVKGSVKSEQVSFLLGGNFVISFQERIGDVFEPVRDRIRKSKGRVRRAGADYLMYVLLDAVVDNYFGVLEKLGEKIEALHDQVATEPSEDTLREIHAMKKEMMALRKSVWPVRELASALQRAESGLIAETTGVFLRDIYDHAVQVIDTTETLREMISGMMDLYLSSISNRTNAVMKVLTIIATIFIPLTFIAGIYGMNFENMPELRWRWAYPAVLGSMVVLVGVMLAYFRKNRWL